MAAPVPRSAKSPVAKSEPRAGLRLVVDNAAPAKAPEREDAPATGQPLPWGVSLVIWAVLAAAGWTAIVFMLRMF